MKEVRELLSDADPVRAEPSLSTDEAREMRKRVVGAVAAQRPVRGPSRLRVAAVAAAVVLVIGAGALASRRFAPVIRDVSQPLLPAPGADAHGRVQVQFATPGGTRIIWTINPEFQVNEVFK